MSFLSVLAVFLSCISLAIPKLYNLHVERNVGGVLTDWIFSEKCYGELGCFSNGPPFFDITERPISFHPSERESINTRFLLYTRLNQHAPRNFTNFNRTDYEQESLQSTFQDSSQIKFIVPGFRSALAPDWINPLKDVLLRTEDLNIFIVDWTAGDGPLYEQAVANTRVVGAEIALFIQYLQNTVGANPEEVHIIGHSLGSHIAGYAGKRTKGLGRITGLDPAGPYFENVDPVVRLSTTDALLVDVIHTNGASNRFKGFGTTESIGHIDFFPNGGRFQPGCPNMGRAIWDFLKNPSLKGPGMFEIMCHHHRAIELFTSSIDSACQMIGTVCDTWDNFLEVECKTCSEHSVCPVMGYEGYRSWKLNKNGPTNVYLNTTEMKPFCNGLI